MMTYSEALFGKKVEAMNMAETESAIEGMEESFRRCEESGHGVSTKETVTLCALRNRRADLFLTERTGVTDPVELARLRDGFAKLFA